MTSYFSNIHRVIHKFPKNDQPVTHKEGGGGD